ncbi:MAG: DUF3126 family protein [Pseudomonadota bacterium]
MSTLSQKEIVALQAYLRQKFTHPGLQVKPRPKAADSAELLLENEFIAVIYKDEDEGEVSYTLTMSILEEDIQE